MESIIGNVQRDGSIEVRRQRVLLRESYSDELPGAEAATPGPPLRRCPEMLIGG